MPLRLVEGTDSAPLPTFKEIKRGTIFCIAGTKELYIKIETMPDNTNCIAIADGNLGYSGAETRVYVIPVGTKLEIT